MSLAVVAALIAVQQTAPPRDSVVAGRVAAYLDAFDRAGELSGTVLLARGSRVLFEKSYGRSTLPSGQPNTTETLFAVASLTKPLTGFITNQLIEQGVLTLEDPIEVAA